MTSAGAEYFPPSMALMLKTAQTEIGLHFGDHGLCAVSGCAFPCQRAEVAAFALDAF